jgi:chromosome segregation ATPase
VELPAEERRRRVHALAGAFRQTRNFEAVQDGGEEAEGEDRLGPMIRLALDDPDEEVRRDAERAVVDAGYQLELRREQERRQILHLRDQLTDTNRRIVELEDEISGLTRDATEAQVARAEHTFEVQGHLGQRDLLTTDGWLTTTEVQVDLEEVRAALQAALAAAAAELELLHALRRRMAREHRAAREVHGAIRTLVRQQEQLEAEIARQEEQQRRAERRAAQAESEQARQQSRLGSLSPPSPPRNRGDAEQYQRDLAAYRNAEARYHSQRHDLENRIAALGGEIRSCRAEVRSCRQAIEQARASWERLGRRIREERSRIDAIRRRIGELEREFRTRQATCREIRREIARLQAEVRRIEARFESERSSRRARLDANTARIGEEQGHLGRLRGELHALSERLNARGDDLDRQRTRGQRLVQAIDSGRQSYERVAGEADQQSAHADASGLAQQRATEQERREEQESLALYVEGVERALRQPPSRRPQRRRSTTGG